MTKTQKLETGSQRGTETKDRKLKLWLRLIFGLALSVHLNGRFENELESIRESNLGINLINVYFVAETESDDESKSL